MLFIIEITLSMVDLGLCAGHIYPGLLEHPALIALDVMIPTIHCGVIGYHFKKNKNV